MGPRHLIIAVALLCGASACAGPRVRASQISVDASPMPGHMRVHAILANSGGRGQVKVTARLQAQAGAALYTGSRPVDVEAKDRVALVLDVPAPGGRYTATLDVSYPAD